jgi:hypothetical protein
MGRRRGEGRGRPVEPEEARSHDNDPEAVEVHRLGDRNGNTDVGEDRRADHEKASERRPVAVAEPPHKPQSPELVMRRDSARWGPIWAGLITAITTFLLLELLAFGLGILTPNFAPGADPTASAWVSAIIGLIAFFTGGSVAGMTSSVRGAATGLLNGFLVWALGTVLILVLSVFGLGQIFGALGNVVGQLGILQGGLSVPGVNLPENVNPQQYVDALRNGALGAFFGLLVSAVACALGGFLGGRSGEPIGHMAQDND